MTNNRSKISRVQIQLADTPPANWGRSSIWLRIFDRGSSKKGINRSERWSSGTAIVGTRYGYLFRLKRWLMSWKRASNR